MRKYIMALDSGTTSSRCILFNERGKACSSAQRELRQYFPRPGWVEHDGKEIWAAQLAVAVEAMQKYVYLFRSRPSALRIKERRRLVWDKNTGDPICPAIVWQCRRTAEYCDELKARGLVDFFRKKQVLFWMPTSQAQS